MQALGSLRPWLTVASVYMKSVHYHLDYAMFSGCSGEIEFSIWMA
jgi:hypothetical protein